MFVTHKLWPFGIEWHIIAWSNSIILFFVELVEVKDSPEDLPPPPQVFLQRENCLFNFLNHQKYSQKG